MGRREQPSPGLPKRDLKAEKGVADLVAMYFSEEELAGLALDVGVDYEALPGRGTAGKARALVGHFGRRGLFDVLIRQLVEERPNVEWPDVVSGR